MEKNGSLSSEVYHCYQLSWVQTQAEMLKYSSEYATSSHQHILHDQERQ